MKGNTVYYVYSAWEYNASSPAVVVLPKLRQLIKSCKKHSAVEEVVWSLWPARGFGVRYARVPLIIANKQHLGDHCELSEFREVNLLNIIAEILVIMAWMFYRWCFIILFRLKIEVCETESIHPGTIKKRTLPKIFKSVYNTFLKMKLGYNTILFFESFVLHFRLTRKILRCWKVT